MNWNETDLNIQTKERVQSLISNFNKFILENHPETSKQPQDVKISMEWQNFHDMINKDPANVEGHNKYVINLREQLIRNQIIRKREEGSADILFGKKNEKKELQVNKKFLKDVVKNLKHLTLKNNTGLNLYG